MKYLFVLAIIAIFIMNPEIPVKNGEKISSANKTPKQNRHQIFQGTKHPQNRQNKTPLDTRPSTSHFDIPDPVESQIIGMFPNSQLIAQIYQGESSFGRNDVCRKYGKYNGFGWRESVFQLTNYGPVCYEDFKTLVSEINAWIEAKKALGLTFAEMNCLYITGHVIDDCNTSYKLN